MFLDWTERSFHSVWISRRYSVHDKPPVFEPKKLEYFGAKHLINKEMKLHPLPGYDATGCPTCGNGVWKDKMQLFLPGLTPPSFKGAEI